MSEEKRDEHSDGFQTGMMKRITYLYLIVKENPNIHMQKLYAKMAIEHGWNPRSTQSYIGYLVTYEVIKIRKGILLEDDSVCVINELKFE